MIRLRRKPRTNAGIAHLPSAERAYAAYARAVDGKNFMGQPMPEWLELPAGIRKAWHCAALAVLFGTVERWAWTP